MLRARRQHYGYWNTCIHKYHQHRKSPSTKASFVVENSSTKAQIKTLTTLHDTNGWWALQTDSCVLHKVNNPWSRAKKHVSNTSEHLNCIYEQARGHVYAAYDLLEVIMRDLLPARCANGNLMADSASVCGSMIDGSLTVLGNRYW